MQRGYITVLGFGKRLLCTFGYGGPALSTVITWTETQCQPAPGGYTEGVGVDTAWAEGSGPGTGWSEGSAPSTTWGESPNPDDDSFWERTKH